MYNNEAGELRALRQHRQRQAAGAGSAGAKIVLDPADHSSLLLKDPTLQVPKRATVATIVALQDVFELRDDHLGKMALPSRDGWAQSPPDGPSDTCYIRRLMLEFSETLGSKDPRKFSPQEVIEFRCHGSKATLTSLATHLEIDRRWIRHQDDGDGNYGREDRELPEAESSPWKPRNSSSTQPGGPTLVQPWMSWPPNTQSSTSGSPTWLTPRSLPLMQQRPLGSSSPWASRSRPALVAPAPPGPETVTVKSKAQAPLRHPSASMVPGWCQSIQHQSPSTLALLPAQSMQTRTPGARWAALESAGSQEHLGLAPRLRPMWVQELRKIHLFGHPHCQWRQDCQTVVQKR
jgi:hypothetical protein